MEIIVENQKKAERFLRNFDREVSRSWLRLFRIIGPKLRQDVKNRIISQNNGSWDPVSKWIRAKKNSRKPLVGVWRYVKNKSITGVGGGKLYLLFESPGDWTLTQHHDGFVNKPTGNRVTIPIVNPRPLGLKAGTKSFSFIDRRGSVVPARKAWPSEDEALKIIIPEITPWFRDVVNRTLARK